MLIKQNNYVKICVFLRVNRLDNQKKDLKLMCILAFLVSILSFQSDPTA